MSFSFPGDRPIRGGVEGSPPRLPGAADDVRAACRAVVEHLTQLGPLMPSVYVERGGRLRCQAVEGYWQILDGMPPTAGVIGATFLSGREHVVREIPGSTEYLAAVDGVVAEACFPLRCFGRVVGALNVECARPLTDADVAEARHCAEHLGERLEDLGGPAPESAAQLLVRHCATMAALTDVDAIEREVVTAAVDICALDSAMVLHVGTDGRLGARWPWGPLSSVLSDAPQEALQTIAAFSRHGTSAYTVGAVGGSGAGLTALREAGANSLAVLGVGNDRILVVASATPALMSTEDSELLELLAAQAAACLRTVASVDALRERAASDALTGLGHHATFKEALRGVARMDGVAVLVIDVDGFKGFNDRHGHQAGDEALRDTAAALKGALRRGDRIFRIGGDEFAALLRVRDADDAREAALRLHAAVAASSSAGISVSIGAALASSQEDGESALERADRALYDVKERGRNGVALAEGTPA